jgi:ribosomal protein L15E
MLVCLTNVGSVSDEKWTCSIESTRQKALRLEKERKEQQQALEEVERQKVGLYSLSCYFILVVRFKIEKSMEA